LNEKSNQQELFAEGGEIDLSSDDLNKPAFEFYRKQRATPSSPETKAAMDATIKEAAKFIIPQDVVDLALLPVATGKVGVKTALALLAATGSSDADAGFLKKLLMREAPNQADQIRQALRQSADTGLEPSVIGPMAMMKSGAMDVGEISAEAKRGLKEYQAAAYGSEIGGYTTLQNFLRTGATKRYGVEHGPETLNALITGIDDGLAKSVLKQPVDLYRGVRDARQIFGQNMENLKIGHVFQDTGYVSTTTDAKIAKSKFAEALNRGDKPVVFHIKAQPGLNAFDMDAIEKIGEKEVLLPRNLPLKITSIKGNTVTVEPVVELLTKKKFAKGGLTQTKECSCHG
jgi:hypothetical protein